MKRGMRYMGWAAGLSTLAACQMVAGIEDTSVFDMDAGGGGPQGYVVRGVATGVLAPLSVEMVYTGGSEILEITEDGAFVFETPFEDRDSYDIELVGEPPCVLESGSGLISGADAEILLACEGAPFLTDLALSGATAPDLPVSLAQTEYTAEVSLLQEGMSITPVALNTEVTITVAGQTVASGTASALLPLDLGDNQVEIVVSHPSGLQRTYGLTVRRAAALAQYAYGKASNAEAGDYFGYSVALSGDILAVGAYGEASVATGVDGNQANNSLSYSGAVYVFRRTGSTWAQEAYLKASNTDSVDYFGWSVTLSGDTLAVGARLEESAATGVDGNQADNSADDSGAVYVFRRSGSTWAQEAYLKASNTGATDYFGSSVALSGNTLAVGAYGEDSAATGVDSDQASNTAVDSGAVYVFRRSGSSWAQEAYLKASNTGASDYFGSSVALSQDTLAVGAYGEDSVATGVDGNQLDNSASNSGAVYVFRHDGSAWAQEAYLKASNTGAGDYFGTSVALSQDTLAVGATEEASADTGVDGNQANNSASDSGAVYVFRRADSAWAQEAYLKASNTGAGDYFGRSVALNGDTLAVGAYREDSAATGAGGSQDDDSAEYSGAVYLFHRAGSAWAQEAYLKASNTGASDYFGYSVALSQDTLAVGAYREDSAATGAGGSQDDDSALESGAAYIFH